jgi:uncharacterized membrane protein YeaQ/YmgE (transglycosylase-associated protein family)
MSIVAWLLLGLIAGFIASKLVGGSGNGLVVDMLLGVLGAFAGGAVFHYAGEPGVTGIDLWSVLVAVVGSVLVLIVYHAIARTLPRDVRVKG